MWECLGGPSPDHWVYVRRATPLDRKLLNPAESTTDSAGRSASADPSAPALPPRAGRDDTDDTYREDAFELFRARGVSFQVI